MKFSILTLFCLLTVANCNFILNSFYKLQNVLFCNEVWIKPDFKGLKRDFKSNIVGQPFLISDLIPSLEKHFGEDESYKKPLVLSFHGSPGVGKSYVANSIVKHIYANGYDSGMVRTFFPKSSLTSDEINSYREELNNDIKKAVLKCEKSIFIFDEVEKLPEGFFGSLDFLKSSRFFHSIYRHALFMFISNLGAEKINAKTNELLKGEFKRDEFNIGDFEDILKAEWYKQAFPDDSEIHRFKEIFEDGYRLIFLPFLPLEMQHVEQCVHNESNKFGRPVEKNIVDKVLSETEFTPDKFSASGCKEVVTKLIINLGIVTPVERYDL